MDKGTPMKQYDAIVVGSGPNGFAAAIRLAQAKLSVLLIEGKETIGGGMRSAELTLPGFIHDICSAIHPLAMGSPFFSTLPLEQHGLRWIEPPLPLAHPFKDRQVTLLDRSVEVTSQTLGHDADAYKKLLQPFVKNWPFLAEDILAPLHFPRHPFAMAQFGYYAIQSAEGLAYRFFKERAARALFAGLAAHAIMPLNKCITAGFALMLGVLGHAVGWPMPAGGTQNLANALASYFRSLGGDIATNTLITNIDQLPPAQAIFFDVTPKQLLNIVGERFPACYRKRMKRYRYGPGVFKIDWALKSPIPWKAKACSQAGTVHLGGTLEEIAHSERQVWNDKIDRNNFIILAQPSLFDPSRAPKGKHVAWAYCHVPNSSDTDLTKEIEAQVEQYAPGFIDCIAARSTMNTIQLEKYNPNYVGGDINGGVEDLSQLFTRPVARINPYSTPIKNVYICSASTPPGGGVHGMCGYHAAQSALKKIFA
jgi:phytoene dehydrogenase-like protein